MKIQVNTSNQIDGSERLNEFVRTQVENALRNFSEKVTTVEVHLDDENSSKEGPDDKRCTIEARIAKLQPIAASDNADTLEKAIAGAAGKIKRAVENSLGKLRQ